MRCLRDTARRLSLLANLTVSFSFVTTVQFARHGATYTHREVSSNGSRGGRSRGGSSSTSSQAQAERTDIVNGGAYQESEVFDWLAKNAGIRTKTVSLGVTSGGYRGLVASEDVAKGQVMLEVPADVCLWSTRDGVVSGLSGQTDLCWEEAGDLRDPVSDEDFARGMTWDVRLALALLEATSDQQIGGKFWSVYGRLLPPPHLVTVPFCLPERLLAQLHNDGMAERARKQVERMRSLYPGMMRTLLSHPNTAIYARKTAGGEAETVPAAETEEVAVQGTDVAPMALLWAFAMVRSRAFAAKDERFAFVPFLDMANHGFAEPTASFEFDGTSPGVFRLQATRNISAGEEVTISYGEQLNAEQLMVQYGFPVPPTVSLERPLCDPSALIRDRSTAATGFGQGAAEAQTQGRVGGKSSLGAAVEEGEGTGGQQEWTQAARTGLMNDLFLRAQQRFAREASGNQEQFEMQVRKVLPLIPPLATKIMELRGSGGDAATGAKTYLEELQAYRSSRFPTNEDQDRQLLSFCVGDGRGKVDPRLADVVRYRLGRKESHSMAAAILEEFLAPAPPAAQPAPGSKIPEEEE